MSQAASKPQVTWEDFYGPNLGYVMDLYDQYLADPDSLDAELRELFDKLGEPSETEFQENAFRQPLDKGSAPSPDAVHKIASAVKLAEDIRTYGHLYASVYPLENQESAEDFLRLEKYELTEKDLKDIPAAVLCPDAPAEVKNGLEAINYLRETYKKTISFEFDHVHGIEEKNWLKKIVESGEIFTHLSNEKKVGILKRLMEVEGFEKYLHKTFVGQKRFSIEGLDMLVPMLDGMIASAVEAGTNTINIGMAHRGRLNVLAHVLGKPYEIIFSEFQHAPNKELVPSEGSIGINYGWSGDVKYHLGADKQIKDESTIRARLTLANNPSHLEFVDPIVAGYTRAAQETRTGEGFPEQDIKKSLAVMIHGDAAFPGEGIVAETLNLSRLKGYQTGGSIHIIANNVIGFTTESKDSRSTRYASDLAKGYEIPIVHVNADDPEACLAAITMAMEYRYKFKKDFLIDLIGYRRFGHNEMDEPMTTQPQVYEKVHKHPTAKEIYKKLLQDESVLTQDDASKLEEEVQNKLDAAYQKVPKRQVTEIHDIELPETILHGFPKVDTSVPLDRLHSINSQLVQWQENFNVFGKLQRILERRSNVMKEDHRVEWGLAETLAFGTIVQDGTPVRLTGQDSERGTFAQRNLVLHDSKTGEVYSPLHTVKDAKATFAVHNSPLSEGSVLGFEYGYNVFAPETLVLWEAQYGDFANAAQVFFDQFISAGRAKWGQKSGLVILLPHGYEGQGPEHSSARLERFLQLASENNWTVANLTSAAQYFHILRRQAKMLQKEEVRPLIIMTPKSLLRNPNTISDAEELASGSFKPIMEQQGLGADAEKVKRVVFCSGKVSIDISEKLKNMEENPQEIHVARVEEIYPFPKEEIKNLIGRFENLEEILWVQEEPQNMGAWSYMEAKLRETAADSIKVRYEGRRRRSSTAEGDPTVHKKEQERIITHALTWDN
ncbi:2-oxoglutarate dehydrogenase E1 component [Metabacillus sp. GX 13764]|uniref:2-oxoglutarate dehydrogenase E1 component n=1 Tax=Metabacillus kandeliae TaxID=2900151 RepID=UPI001E4E233A|nr:2-oxoglutarate dehydrogenase E1 component [Metabacillus kandeliae]MCD7033523.1 2-oxoglutarate dehydrogenase E1 component [Metabacillus kandeliae]